MFKPMDGLLRTRVAVHSFCLQLRKQENAFMSISIATQIPAKGFGS